MEKNQEELLPTQVFLGELRKDYNTELKPRTLQSYHSLYDLLPGPTYKGGHTGHFKRKELSRVRLIVFLRKNGWGLSEIKKLLDNLPSIDAINRIVNGTMAVSRVDWLISELTKSTPSTDGSTAFVMYPEFKILMESFLDHLSGRLENVYDGGIRSRGEPQAVVDSARAEFQKQREEFFSRLDLIKEEINSQEFEDRMNGLLKEFRGRLKQGDTAQKNWVKDWVKNRFSAIVFNFVFRLEV